MLWFGIKTTRNEGKRIFNYLITGNDCNNHKDYMLQSLWRGVTMRSFSQWFSDFDDLAINTYGIEWGRTEISLMSSSSLW